MNESSRLFPASMRAQSDAAIAALRTDNDALETAGKALDAFINDDTNRSAAFENLRRKMQDFRAVADALIKANDADIADHQRLTHLVGSQDLNGAVIIPLLESNLRSRAEAEDRIAHYARVRSRASLLQKCSLSDRTYSNAWRSQQRWENYLRTVNRIITKLEGKVRSYNDIERATRELLTSGGDLRSAAARGLEYIQEAAAGLPGSYDSEGLGAWRSDIAVLKEHAAAAENVFLQNLFDELIARDADGNIIEVDWDALEKQEPTIIRSILDKFLRDFYINAGATVAVATAVEAGLVNFLNNMTFSAHGIAYELGFTVTPEGFAKAIGNGIVVIGAGITFVNELQGGENIVNATLYTAGNAGIAWGVKEGIARGTKAGIAWSTKAAAGAKVGAKVGALVGSAIPVVGTIVGVAVGAFVGAIGSTLFSNLYNNHVREHVDSFVDSAREAFNDIGQGIRGFFSNLGSAFGG